MGKLIIHHEKVTPEKAAALVKLCPFNAITYQDSKLEINSACKMCKMCVRKGEGLVTFEEETVQKIDKSLWRGICVYADCSSGKLHRVTLELCGKAKELAGVTGHPVYAIMIGNGMKKQAQELLAYGVDKVFLYDDPAFAEFRIEPYTAAFCDLSKKKSPPRCWWAPQIWGGNLPLAWQRAVVPASPLTVRYWK